MQLEAVESQWECSHNEAIEIWRIQVLEDVSLTVWDRG
jgi:hypothetical protein